MTKISFLVAAHNEEKIIAKTLPTLFRKLSKNLIPDTASKIAKGKITSSFETLN